MKTRWKIMTLISVVVAALDITAILTAAHGQLQKEYLIGIVGIITFLGSLLAINYQSGCPNLDKGEIRKSMTVSTFVVYFLMLGLNDVGNKAIMESFTGLVEIIVALYFGGKLGTEVVQYLGTKDKQGTKTDE